MPKENYKNEILQTLEEFERETNDYHPNIVLVPDDDAQIINEDKLCIPIYTISNSRSFADLSVQPAICSTNDVVINHPNINQILNSVFPQNIDGTLQLEKNTRKRKRVTTTKQRYDANIRERRRMVSLNKQFDKLKIAIPKFSYETKISRIETLRVAILYIDFMKKLLNNTIDYDNYKNNIYATNDSVAY